MGKKKATQKQPKPNPTPPQRREEPKNPPPPPPPAVQPGAMISAAALETFLRASNPNVDWSATIAALSQVAGTVATVSATPTATAPPTTTTQITTQTTIEPSPQKSMPTTKPETPKPSSKLTLTEPLDVTPISTYISPGAEKESGDEGTVVGEETTKAEEGIDEVKERIEGKGEEKAVTGETQIEEGVGNKKVIEEKELDEIAKKQGLVTDDEFQKLLDGVQRAERDATRMVEGLDLASPAVKGEIPKESTRETESVSA